MTTQNPKAYTLMTPGPVPVPREVLEVLGHQMEHHRTPEFISRYKQVLDRLKLVFKTEQPVYIHTSTGTGAMESALVNCLSPGDKVVAIVSGKFGERWAEIASTYGAQVIRIEVPWGQVVKTEQLENALIQNPDTKIVLCQACETSTGVLHPIKELAEIIKKTSAIFVVDGITALGAVPLPMDDWSLDVVIAGSQKAFMLPTGLAFISFSKKAQALFESARCPRYYFDIRKEQKAMLSGESAFSSSVSNIRALDVILNLFLSKGLATVQNRIQALSDATRAAVDIMGLQSFAEVASPSLTAISLPAGIDGQIVRSKMEKDHQAVVMGGQDQLKGKIIRIGHMGAISDSDLFLTLDALAQSLNSIRPTISEEQLNKALQSAKEILTRTPAFFSC